MDALVLRGLAKWPNVPAVYGWLSLDRRGQWRIKGERIANPALNEFIGRNYESDPQGRWYFQNGPQRVFVRLEYTPLVVRYEGDALRDHCGRDFHGAGMLVDDGGNVLVEGEGTIALLDDRDLGRVADHAATFPAIRAAEVPAKYRFTAEPAP